MRRFFWFQAVFIILNLSFLSCKSKAAPIEEPPAVIPQVLAPEFIVTKIAVVKAELINTRFRVSLKIINPNLHPIELSGLSYELYGNGLLWAEGQDKSEIKIPSESAITGDLTLGMNFIDTNRNLLDQVINLEQIYYNFKGEVLVSSDSDFFSAFKSDFDLSGFSEVLEK